MEKFYPDIKIISKTPKIIGAFSPLVYAAAHFAFDKGGKRLFRNGQREYISQGKLAAILASKK
jgi:hypothetical protein